MMKNKTTCFSMADAEGFEPSEGVNLGGIQSRCIKPYSAMRPYNKCVFLSIRYRWSPVSLRLVFCILF